MDFSVALSLVSTLMAIANALPADVYPVPIDYPGVKACLAYLAKYQQQSFQNYLQARLVKALAQVVDDGRIFYLDYYLVENGIYGGGNIKGECRAVIHFGYDTSVRLVNNKPPTCRNTPVLPPSYPTYPPPYTLTFAPRHPW